MVTPFRTLEISARNYLFKNTEKTMAVLDPIPLFIINKNKKIYVQKSDILNEN